MGNPGGYLKLRPHFCFHAEGEASSIATQGKHRIELRR